MNFWKPRPVKGTGLEVRPISAREMVEFQALFSDESVDDPTKLIKLAHMSAFKSGKRAWTLDEAGDQPWPLIQCVTDLALEVNGLTGKPVEQAEGN